MFVDLNSREMNLIEEALDCLANSSSDKRLREIDQIGQKLTDAQNKSSFRIPIDWSEWETPIKKSKKAKYTINTLEIDYFKDQIRQDFRKHYKGIISLRKKYGAGADLSKLETRQSWLTELYVKLGGSREALYRAATK